MDRWSWVMEQKPRPVVDVLQDEVARLLEKELRRWPLPVEELEPAYAARYASAFEPGAPRPHEPVYAQAFVLARWELEREVLAVDEYFRNERYLEAGLAPGDKPALLVLSRWLTEQMLALSEITGGRLKRPALVEILRRTARLRLSSALAS